MFFLMATSVGAQTKMDPARATELRSKVKAQSGSTRTITSDFTQYKHLDFLSSDIESKGKLAFKAPDQIKWEYTVPFAYSVLFKNQKLYINDGGNKSSMDLGGSTIFMQLNRLIAASIRGDMFDEAAFDIDYYTLEGHDLVHFMPKDEQFAEFIKVFHIRFGTAGEVDMLKMIEPSGDYTQIIFSNRSQNQPLSDAIFAH